MDEHAEPEKPVWEVHPEVSFTLLETQAGRSLCFSKKTWAGAAERRALLSGAGITVPTQLGIARRYAAVDDVFDAAVAVWSCLRLLSGSGVSYPDPPEATKRGRTTAIFA